MRQEKKMKAKEDELKKERKNAFIPQEQQIVASAGR